MSASEKLKALEAALTEGYDRTLAKAEPPYFSRREIGIYRNALPQIRTLVEAAERVSGVGADVSYQLAGPLAALDEALGDIDG